MNSPDVLDLIKEKGELIFFRSGKNHPWRKMNILAKTLPPLGKDPFHEERNASWWNNCQIPAPSPILLKILKELNK